MGFINVDKYSFKYSIGVKLYILLCIQVVWLGMIINERMNYGRYIYLLGNYFQSYVYGYSYGDDKECKYKVKNSFE